MGRRRRKKKEKEERNEEEMDPETTAGNLDPLHLKAPVAECRARRREAVEKGCVTRTRTRRTRTRRKTRKKKRRVERTS